MSWHLSVLWQGWSHGAGGFVDAVVQDRRCRQHSRLHQVTLKRSFLQINDSMDRRCHSWVVSRTLEAKELSTEQIIASSPTVDGCSVRCQGRECTLPMQKFGRDGTLCASTGVTSSTLHSQSQTWVVCQCQRGQISCRFPCPSSVTSLGLAVVGWRPIPLLFDKTF